MRPRVVTFWKDGEKSRPGAFRRPCPCGCDTAAYPGLVGHYSRSDAKGDGMTVLYFDEGEFQSAAAAPALLAEVRS